MWVEAADRVLVNLGHMDWVKREKYGRLADLREGEVA